MPKSRFGIVAALAAVTVAAAACAGRAQPPGGEAQRDLLSEIKARGVLRVSTDPAYPPQSRLNKKAGQWEGFDIDVAREVSRRLGLEDEPEWVTPAWEAITAGNWQGRWDLSVGSMTVTPERAQVLHFVAPYYYTPASVAVSKEDTAVRDVSSHLDGKRIGVCGGCTYEFYLEKTLEIPGEDIEFVIDEADVRTYDTDTTAIQDLVLGRLDAVISSVTTLQEAIGADTPIRIVDTVFFEPLSVAIDRRSRSDAESLVAEVDRIVKEMHGDGTLSRLSEKWFGQDLTKKE